MKDVSNVLIEKDGKNGGSRDVRVDGCGEKEEEFRSGRREDFIGMAGSFRASHHLCSA